MIRRDGWMRYCIWEHSATVRDLYRQRCRGEAEEMTAHAQAAELLQDRASAGDTVLDAGCGSGYFYHSLRARGIPAHYWGIDAAPTLIEIGRAELPAFGLPADRLQAVRLEELCHARLPSRRSAPSRSRPRGNRRGMLRPDLCWCTSDNRCTGRDQPRCGRKVDDLRPSPRTYRLRSGNTRCMRAILHNPCNSRS